MERIQEKELEQWIKAGRNVILFENKNTINPLIRLFAKNEKREAISYILFARGKKQQEERFGIKVQCLKEDGAESSGVTPTDEDTLLIIESRNEEENKESLEQAREVGFSNILLLDNEAYFRMQKEENQRHEFLCVGFSKSGTTSIHSALKTNKKVFLPAGKETFYLNWKNGKEDAPEIYKQRYFTKVRDGHTVGAIEPSYYKRAKEVYACFGKDVKLIFVMRNPAGATYSYYRMMMRRPRKLSYIKYYKKYGKYTVDMFSDYVEDEIATRKQDRFFYDAWIEEYLEYFPKEQMKFVFFEELVQEPERIMNEIQEFIGVKKKKIKELPKSNEGSMVSRNAICARLNYYYLQEKLKSKKQVEVSKKSRSFLKFMDRMQKYTCIETKEKMKPEQRERLQELYGESVRNLEKICGRSLDTIWF